MRRLSVLIVFFVVLLISQPTYASNIEVQQVFMDLPLVSMHLVTDIDPTADELSATIMGKPLELKEIVPIRKSKMGLACVFLVDISASLKPAQLQVLQNVMRQWANTMGKYDQVAVITVGEAVTNLISFSRDPDKLRKTALELKAGDNRTLWYEGILAAKKLIEETKDVPEQHIIIALSDGMNDGGRLTYAGMLKSVMEFNAPYYMLGLLPEKPTAASAKAQKEMQEVAAATHGQYFPVTRDEEIFTSVGTVQTREFSGVLAVFEAPGGIPYDGSEAELALTFTRNGTVTTVKMKVALYAKPGVTPKPDPTSTPLPTPTPLSSQPPTPSRAAAATHSLKSPAAPTISPVATPEPTSAAISQYAILGVILPTWWPWAAGAIAAMVLVIILFVMKSIKLRRRKHAPADETLDRKPSPVKPAAEPQLSDDIATTAPEHEPEPITQDKPWMPRWTESGPMQISITLISDDGSRFSFDIPTTGRLVIGSSVSAGLTLQGAGLAARHCELFFMDGLWFAAHLGSGTTRLNSISVKGAMRMENRDLLQLGEVKMIVYLPDANSPSKTEQSDGNTHTYQM